MVFCLPENHFCLRIIFETDLSSAMFGKKLVYFALDFHFTILLLALGKRVREEGTVVLIELLDRR